ncbi:uncharacterized protein MCYG_04458 [Microsporum canis CBS 113480]|uniref:Uncharacterized protein n=1 Tax=Arthroderma otae (strain ATCC MYA-4605 / CBS 113480) TaxID=554155 RepID=C5FPN4_ARTOC|nr:uncharacterized protein MCYG_04458 [Microsporum canis CBS 113480]EEQ31639.1 predicted protein [Microsporum canis CBS 113480]
MGSVTSSLSESTTGRGHSRRHKRRHSKGGRKRQSSSGSEGTALNMLLLVALEYMKIEIEIAKIRLSRAKNEESHAARARRRERTPVAQESRGRECRESMSIDGFQDTRNFDGLPYHNIPDPRAQMTMHDRHRMSRRGP